MTSQSCDECFIRISWEKIELARNVSDLHDNSSVEEMVLGYKMVPDVPHCWVKMWTWVQISPSKPL